MLKFRLVKEIEGERICIQSLHFPIGCKRWLMKKNIQNAKNFRKEQMRGIISIHLWNGFKNKDCFFVETTQKKMRGREEMFQKKRGRRGYVNIQFPFANLLNNYFTNTLMLTLRN